MTQLTQRPITPNRLAFSDCLPIFDALRFGAHNSSTNIATTLHTVQSFGRHNGFEYKYLVVIVFFVSLCSQCHRKNSTQSASTFPGSDQAQQFLIISSTGRPSEILDLTSFHSLITIAFDFDRACCLSNSRAVYSLIEFLWPTDRARTLRWIFHRSSPVMHLHKKCIVHFTWKKNFPAINLRKRGTEIEWEEKRERTESDLLNWSESYKAAPRQQHQRQYPQWGRLNWIFLLEKINGWNERTVGWISHYLLFIERKKARERRESPVRPIMVNHSLSVCLPMWKWEWKAINERHFSVEFKLSNQDFIFFFFLTKKKSFFLRLCLQLPRPLPFVSVFGHS